MSTLQMAPKHPDLATESNRILSGFVERSASTHLTQNNPRSEEEKISSTLVQQSLADRPIVGSDICVVLQNVKQSAPGEDYLVRTDELCTSELPDCTSPTLH